MAMHGKSQSLQFAIAALLITLLTSLACSLTSNEAAQIDLQSTIVALEITKIFLENQAPQEPPPPVEQITLEPPPPSEIPDTQPTETPIQQAETPDIVFEGIQFSFDPGSPALSIPPSILGKI
jgi:hypothetical protein